MIEFQSRLIKAKKLVRNMKQWLFVLLVSILFVPSCFDDPAGIVCDTMAMAGITVQVKDIVSGLGIAEGACAWIQDGSFIDTLEYCGDDSLGNPMILSGAWERSGTYSLTIEKEAYTTYHQDTIEVLDDVCHVQGVNLTAMMVRDVSVVAETFPDTVKYGECFDIHVTVTNNSNEDFILHYDVSCPMSYYIYDSDGMPIGVAPRFCDDVLTTFELAPFEIFEETKSIFTDDYLMTPGRYTVKTGLRYGYFDEVEVVVVP